MNRKHWKIVGLFAAACAALVTGGRLGMRGDASPAAPEVETPAPAPAVTAEQIDEIVAKRAAEEIAAREAERLDRKQREKDARRKKIIAELESGVLRARAEAERYMQRIYALGLEEERTFKRIEALKKMSYDEMVRKYGVTEIWSLACDELFTRIGNIRAEGRAAHRGYLENERKMNRLTKRPEWKHVGRDARKAAEWVNSRSLMLRDILPRAWSASVTIP